MHTKIFNDENSRFRKLEMDEYPSPSSLKPTDGSDSSRFRNLEIDETPVAPVPALRENVRAETLAERTERTLQDIRSRFEHYRALEIIGKEAESAQFHYRFLSTLFLEKLGLPIAGRFADGKPYLASLVTKRGLTEGIRELQTLYPEWKRLLGQKNEYFYDRSFQFNKKGFWVEADLYQVQAFLRRLTDLHPNLGAAFGLLNGAAARNLGEELRKNYFHLDSGLRRIMTGELVKGQPETTERIISAAETIGINLNGKQTKTFRQGLYQFADPPGFSVMDAFTNSDIQTAVVVAVEIPFDDI